MKQKRILRRYRFSSGGHCLDYTEHTHTFGEKIKLGWLTGLVVLGFIIAAGYIATTFNTPSIKVSPLPDNILAVGR